jgi:hypothetical protein
LERFSGPLIIGTFGSWKEIFQILASIYSVTHIFILIFGVLWPKFLAGGTTVTVGSSLLFGAMDKDDIIDLLFFVSIFFGFIPRSWY